MHLYAFLVAFFPSQNCYFLSVTFFPVTFFPSTANPKGLLQRYTIC